jgi:hypothetical protein
VYLTDRIYPQQSVGGGGRVRPGQQLDAVASEQRNVTFPQPQRSVVPESGSALGVVGGCSGMAGGEAGVGEERVTRFDGEACGVLGVFELGAGDHVVGREPGETAGGRDVEQHASGEHAVFWRGDGVGGQALAGEDFGPTAAVVADVVGVDVAECVQGGAPAVHLQGDGVGDGDSGGRM